jgi:glycosyltransferase involved in cell wall biosynthesis
MPSVTFSRFSYSQEVAPSYDLVCLSHLRWDFVYQRPQHLMSRFARERRVFFVEEPFFGDVRAHLEVSLHSEGVWIVVPFLPQGIAEEEANRLQALLLDDLFMRENITSYVLWYYTPMALAFTTQLEPLAIVYDCMDELSAFNHAPPELRRREAELFVYADLVFTGGQSLYEAKREHHQHVHAFPSSVDLAHFRQARAPLPEPCDQASIPHPRLGFYGVIDERMDIPLLCEIADAQPDWHLVIVGPVATPKFDPALLPRRANIHYPGHKSYTELPAYLAGWDVAIMPFAHNASTRFISPTKTLEYLAGGKPVVSTSIRDVVSPYGEQGLVSIADTASGFIDAAKRAISGHDSAHVHAIDAFLSQTSWDVTWKRMCQLIEVIVAERQNWPAYSYASSVSSHPEVFTETSIIGGNE